MTCKHLNWRKWVNNSSFFYQGLFYEFFRFIVECCSCIAWFYGMQYLKEVLCPATISSGKISYDRWGTSCPALYMVKIAFFSWLSLDLGSSLGCSWIPCLFLQFIKLPVQVDITNKILPVSQEFDEQDMYVCMYAPSIPLSCMILLWF